MVLDILSNVHQLKTRKVNDTTQVWDPIRKKWVLFTPEEMVRQLFVHFLIHEKNISQSAISIEKQIRLDKKIKRCDIIVYDQDIKPLLLIECKSPEIKLTATGISQVVRYHQILNTTSVCIVNGHHYRVFRKDSDQKWKEVDDF
jgi:hypothetical protein